MKNRTQLYIGLAFIIYGFFEWNLGRPMEFGLYALIGGAFVITWYSMNGNLEGNTKKLFVISSWLLIILALLWFLYLVRSENWQ